MVPCLHIGSSSSIVVTAPDAPFDVTATLQPMNIVQAAADLVWSPVLRKFPRLKIALSEGGVGWLPYFLDKIDLVYRKQSGVDRTRTTATRLPSEVFRDRIITCFLDDRVTPDVAERAGTENMTWECDYPHSDSDWPYSPEVALAGMAGLDDATINAITHENAMRLFHFDPFAHRPAEAMHRRCPPRRGGRSRASTPSSAACAPVRRPWAPMRVPSKTCSRLAASRDRRGDRGSVP